MESSSMIYYTIVNANNYMPEGHTVISWPILFQRLDKKVSDAGYSISGGRTITENPYKNNDNAKHIRIDLDQQYRLESGQMLTLLKANEF